MEAPKLTKKQRKGVAFRQGRRKKPTEADLQELPEADVLDAEPLAEEVQEVKKVPGSEAGKKRKRSADDVDGTEKGKKKRKADDGAAVDQAVKPTEVEIAKKGKDQPKKRYLLFVGNLPKDVTDEQIASHFSSLPSKPTIRLRRPAEPKPNMYKPAPPPKGRPKIFAFLEFTNSSSLQAALKLNRSNLGGKLINVELTVGGGGSGEGRREKLANKRKQAAEKLNEYAKESAVENKKEKRNRPQGAGGEREPRPKIVKPVRYAASGVNAIPVG